MQVSSIRTRTCRAPRVIRAPTCSTRFRNVAISAWASTGVSVKPRISAQHTRSVAASGRRRGTPLRRADVGPWAGFLVKSSRPIAAQFAGRQRLALGDPRPARPADPEPAHGLRRGRQRDRRRLSSRDDGGRACRQRRAWVSARSTTPVIDGAFVSYSDGKTSSWSTTTAARATSSQTSPACMSVTVRVRPAFAAPVCVSESRAGNVRPRLRTARAALVTDLRSRSAFRAPSTSAWSRSGRACASARSVTCSSPW